jgi:hypothetical protein
MMNRRRGLYIHVRNNSVAWILFVVVFGPFIGFAIGFFATSVNPALTNLTTPLVCRNGALQTSDSSSSNGPGSVTYKLSVNCLNNGGQEDVTGRVEVTVGLIFAAAAFIVLVVIAVFMWAIQPADSEQQ